MTEKIPAAAKIDEDAEQAPATTASMRHVVLVLLGIAGMIALLVAAELLRH